MTPGQRKAMLIACLRAAERIADALQRIITSAATALAHAGRLRGIRETITNFEETP